MTGLRGHEESGGARRDPPTSVLALLWGMACLVALAAYVLLGYPLLPLLVMCTVIVAVDRVLTQEGRSLPVRWTASLTAGLIAFLALWHG